MVIGLVCLDFAPKQTLNPHTHTKKFNEIYSYLHVHPLSRCLVDSGHCLGNNGAFLRRCSTTPRCLCLHDELISLWWWWRKSLVHFLASSCFLSTANYLSLNVFCPLQMLCLRVPLPHVLRYFRMPGWSQYASDSGNWWFGARVLLHLADSNMQNCIQIQDSMQITWKGKIEKKIPKHLQQHMYIYIHIFIDMHTN